MAIWPIPLWNDMPSKALKPHQQTNQGTLQTVKLNSPLVRETALRTYAHNYLGTRSDYWRLVSQLREQPGDGFSLLDVQVPDGRGHDIVAGYYGDLTRLEH
jgi:hypothetical protein